MKKKIFTALLVLLAFTLIACSQNPSSDTENQEGENQNAPETQEVPEEDKLAQFNYGGAAIRVLTSTNSTDGIIINSNYMIEGTGEVTGEIVNDAVFKRNEDVANLLNVEFEYTHMDEDYGTVQSAISRVIASGMDEYDIIINDLRSLVNLSLQGMFINTKQNAIFDLSQDYWYSDFMEDVAIGREKSFILAGDYFIDILRNCHALFLNQSMLNEQRQNGSDEVHKMVIDGKWTFDEFLKLSKEFLRDLDGTGVISNTSHQFGFICVGTWGSAMPFMMAADTGVFTKDSDGIPALTINNPRSHMLHDYLTELFHNQESGARHQFGLDDLIPQFMSRRSLMVGYQRLSTLESLRMMEDDVAILPYPKLSAEQEKYVTCAHDTIEVGAIPVTTPGFDMISVVLEALNRETERTVLPAYYEQSLKIKYVRDDYSAQIIDIIRGSMGNVFALAYSETISGVLGLYDVNATRNFMSGYERLEQRILQRLDEVIEQFLE